MHDAAMHIVADELVVQVHVSYHACVPISVYILRDP